VGAGRTEVARSLMAWTAARRAAPSVRKAGAITTPSAAMRSGWLPLGGSQERSLFLDKNISENFLGA